MKTRGLTYLNKLVLYGFLLGVVPLLALGFFSYFRTSGTIQEYVEEGNFQILKLSQSRIEQNLKTVEASATTMLHSPFVESVLSLPLEGKYYNEFEQLTGTIRQLQVFELGVSDIEFYNMHGKWQIGNKGIYPFNQDESHPTLDIPQKTIWESNKNGIRMISKKPAYDPDPDVIITADIPFSHLRKLLLDTSPLGSVFMLDSEMKLLGYQDESFTRAFLGETELANQLKRLDGDGGKVNVHYGKQEYSVTFIRSSLTGWMYVSAVSIDMITQESKAIGQFTIWICLIITFAVLIFSVMGSNRFYSPIRKLYATVVGQDVQQQPLHNLKREDELQQIGTRFHSLLNRQQEMSGQIQGQVVQLNQFFVQKLFFGEVGPREIKEKLSDLQFPQSWQRMYVMAVEIDTLEGSRYEGKDLDLLLFAVNNIAGELAPRRAFLNPIVLHESQLTILGTDSSDPSWEEDVFKLAEEIQRAVRTYLGISVSVGLSYAFEEWTKVPKAYKEAIDALRYRVKLGHETIISIRDIFADSPAETSYPVKISDELRQAVHASDLEQATFLLHQMVRELVVQPFHFHDYQFSLMRFLSELGSLLQDQGISIRTLMKDDESIVESLFNLRTTEEVEAWFKEVVVGPVLLLLEERRSHQFRKISEAVIQIIHDEYDTDLTLELCADRIEYHPHYVSKVFRQEAGVNFGDYLLQYRLTIAKKMLVETNMKISDISEKLKYTNSTNFIRSFRKVEGETPGQYRERMQEIPAAGSPMK
ncbi:helix-turn-helix domain-containing protein [Paenibacillus qinlingensis]|uniref:helix-turn-helix domain-containing protein n=1 Tax=Paenibacillus qinlingensis TaxID=1837343 RepID=UPI001564F1AE|nr:helix-turn-helix domain-containing protein [Paenibacillus qinlingensis]NQX61145.1 AraC family transcriptional regulator [Paenibacillus qinlingensis]